MWGWVFAVGVTSSSGKGSVVSKPRQRGGHGPKTERNEIEKEEEEDILRSEGRQGMFSD
jgi:hypothetical protein